MLKGHVFSEQIFAHPVFALFVDTFLNGQCGISQKRGQAMKVTYSGTTLNIANGYVCIKGRFLEEDSSAQISASTDNSYNILVIEIDMNKTNTEDTFNQASYKIIKGTSAYPALTQNDIVANDEGIYQFELARFKTNSNGITDFKDTREYLDFEGIFSWIQIKMQEMVNEYETLIGEVQDGSAFFMNDRIKIFENEIDDSIGKERRSGTCLFY